MSKIKSKDNVGKATLMISIVWLIYIIYDSFGKYYLDLWGVLPWIYKLFYPDAKGYVISMGYVTLYSIPFTVLIFILSIYLYKKENNIIRKRTRIIFLITLAVQLIILIIYMITK